MKIHQVILNRFFKRIITNVHRKIVKIHWCNSRLVSFFFNRPNGPRGPAIALAFFFCFFGFSDMFLIFFLNVHNLKILNSGRRPWKKTKNLKPKHFVAILLFPVGGLGSRRVSVGYIWTSSSGFHWFSIDVWRKIVKTHCFFIYS